MPKPVTILQLLMAQSPIARQHAPIATAAASEEEEEQSIVDHLRSLEDEAYKPLLAPVLGHFIRQLVSFSERQGRPSSSPFDAQGGLPEISIQSYLDRIIKYCPCSKECYFVMLVYLDRCEICRVLHTSAPSL